MEKFNYVPISKVEIWTFQSPTVTVCCIQWISLCTDFAQARDFDKFTWVRVSWTIIHWLIDRLIVLSWERRSGPMGILGRWNWLIIVRWLWFFPVFLVPEFTVRMEVRIEHTLCSHPVSNILCLILPLKCLHQCYKKSSFHYCTVPY